MMIEAPTKWKAREDLQLRWQKTWEEPHMQEGLAALIEMGFPSPTLSVDINQHALNNSFREGYHEMITNIGRLKPQITVVRTPEPIQFEYIRKKAEAMIKPKE